jgi:hypothetical protein
VLRYKGFAQRSAAQCSPASVTLRLSGDEVGDYLGVGEHFCLWLGDDVAEGVITRRLFV